jgi:hypothetical protein
MYHKDTQDAAEEKAVIHSMIETGEVIQKPENSD